MKKLFGTDGIRSVAGEAPLDEHTLGRIGSALVEEWKQQGIKPRVILGRDTQSVRGLDHCDANPLLGGFRN